MERLEVLTVQRQFAQTSSSSLLHDYWYLTKVWSVESTQSVVLCHSLLIAGDLAALKINQMQPAECFHSRQRATCAIPAANVESPTSTVAN